MSLVDRARMLLAVEWYGLWLELHSIPGRRRRELKRELRANLLDAATHSSMRQAIRDLGGLRALAGAVARDGVDRPRWRVAAVAAVAALGVLFNLELIAALNWASGVVDGGGARTTGTVFPFPGSIVTYEPPGFGMALQPGWAPLVTAMVVFVVVARPWCLLRRRAARPQVGLGSD